MIKKSIPTFIQTSFSFKYSNVFLLWNVKFTFQKLLLASWNSKKPHKLAGDQAWWTNVMNSHGCPKMSILGIVCTSPPLRGLYCGAEVGKPFQTGQAESMNAVQDSSVWAISEQIIHSFVVCVREKESIVCSKISPFNPSKITVEMFWLTVWLWHRCH